MHMADSTPLLSADPESPLIISKHLPLPSLDETFELYIGDFGWAQLFQAFFVSFAWVFDAQQTFISVFTDAEPPWHCTTTQIGSGSDSEPCTSVSDVCRLPSGGSWAWDRSADTSIISEWNLACAGSIMKSLPASSFFMGCMVGGLVLSTLSDSSLGRKNMLFVSCLLMSAAGVLTIFSPNVIIYSGLRFVSGFGRATIGTCALVLSTELVGKRCRGQVGVIGFFLFTLGFLTLPAIAYLNRDSSWRYLYLWTSVPGLLYSFLVPFLVRESPRWLLVRGRTEEAVATLKSIGGATAVNNINSSFSGLLAFKEEEEERMSTTTNLNLFSAISILLEKRWAMQRLCAIMTVGFGVGIVYYGMPLALGNLPFNLYWNVTFNALSELPASLIAFFFIERLDRKSSLLAFTMISGVCSIMCVVIMGDEKEQVSVVKIGLELVSYFSTCTAFDILLIYNIELFPTSVRNSAMAMVRQAQMLGGAFCPAIVELGRGRGSKGYLSYGVFGLVIISCGLFVGCLPETRGGRLCDTMEEEENKQQLRAAGSSSSS